MKKITIVLLILTSSIVFFFLSCLLQDLLLLDLQEFLLDPFITREDLGMEMENNLSVTVLMRK